MHISPIQLKIVPFAVAAMLGGLATSAMAVPVVYPNATANPSITLDATYSLGGGALVDGMTDPVANIRERADGADFYLFKSGGSPNNVFFHTYGYTGNTTYFGARASGQGQFFGNTRATFSQTFTNTSGSAQVYNFSFMVDQGDLGLRGTGVGFAKLLLDVKKDGTTVAKDLTHIAQDASGTTCIDDDIGLTNTNGAYMSCANGAASNAFGLGGMFSVNMGVVNAGDSFTLDYDIIATVSGDLSAGNSTIYQACNNGFGEEGEGRGDGDFNLALLDDDGPIGDPDAEICSFQSFFPGSAIARTGDPFNGPRFAGGTGPSAANVNSFMVTNSPATVPEPGSIALMGLALAGLAATRRKKSQGQG